jgi:hypothetical protein
MHPRPVNVAVVLVLCPVDEVEVAAHHEGKVASFNRKSELPQELLSATVVSWTINDKEGPLGIVVQLTHVGPDEEGPLSPP